MTKRTISLSDADRRHSTPAHSSVSDRFKIVARTLAAVAAASATLLVAHQGECQIKRPGAHAHYSVELEPHLLIQHDRSWRGRDEGWGPGIRATIPLVHNGPIPQINNNIGIGFGLDWAMYDDCDDFWALSDCGADFVWIPVVAQWNFFLTPVISVFGEPGAAFRYRKFHFEGACPNFDDDECDESDFDPFEPVFFAGGRFLFSETIGLVVRLGTPYVSVGATFLM